MKGYFFWVLTWLYNFLLLLLAWNDSLILQWLYQRLHQVYCRLSKLSPQTTVLVFYWFNIGNQVSQSSANLQRPDPQINSLGFTGDSQIILQSWFLISLKKVRCLLLTFIMFDFNERDLHFMSMSTRKPYKRWWKRSLINCE